MTVIERRQGGRLLTTDDDATDGDDMPIPARYSSKKLAVLQREIERWRTWNKRAVGKQGCSVVMKLIDVDDDNSQQLGPYSVRMTAVSRYCDWTPATLTGGTIIRW